MEKKDSIKDCMKPDDNPQNMVYDDVSTDELCTIMMAKKANVFNKTTYMDNLKNEEKDILNFGQSMKNHKVCNIHNKKAYDNCALALENPYISTYEYKNKPSNYYCSFMQDIYETAPTEEEKELLSDEDKEKTKYNIYKDKTTIDKPKLIIPSTSIYESKEKKHFCESRWHDCFCIPNYHLNNAWYNSVANGDKNTQSVGKCYQPCPIGFKPAPTSAVFTNTPTGIDKCIMHNGGFSYLPISLICLLGTTFEEFKDPEDGYVSYLEEFKTMVEKYKNDLFLKTSDDKTNIYDTLKDELQNNKENTVWLDIKNDIQKYVKNIFLAYTVDDKFIKNMYKDSRDFENFNNPDINKFILYAYKIAFNIHNNLSSSNPSSYIKWRENLKSVTGLHESQFSFLLKMLKHSCNICFDGKTFPHYSKDIILHNLKNNESIKLEIKEIELDINKDPKPEEKKPLNSFKFKTKKNIGIYDHIDNVKNTYQTIMEFIMKIFVYLNIFILIYIIYVYYFEFYTHYLLNVPFTLIYYVWRILAYVFGFIWYYLLYIIRIDRNTYVTYLNENRLIILEYKKKCIEAILSYIEEKYKI